MIRLDDRRALLILVGLVALFVVSRLWQLEADPPLAMFHGWRTEELLREPPAKSHEARNWALFHAWKLEPVDSYQFWRSQAPAWVYPLAGTFRAFGASYATLRGFAIAVTALGLVPLFAFLRRNTGAVWPAGLVISILALDSIGYVYDRAGFLEPAVAAWTMLAIDCLDRARARPAWALVAQWAFVGAFFTKQAAVLAAPVFFGATALLLVHADRRTRLGLVLHGAALVLACGLWITSTDYVENATWNIQNALDYHEDEGVTPRTMAFAHNLRLLLTVFGLPILLALPFWARTLVDLRETRSAPWFRALTAVWWLGTVGGLLALKVTALRYLLVFYPPALIAAGLGAFDLHQARATSRFARGYTAVIGIALVAFVGLHSAERLHLARTATWELASMPAFLHEHIEQPRSAVVIGMWAAPAVLGSDVRHFYVKGSFNDTAAILRQLHVTHLLLLTDGAEQTRTILKRRYPTMLKHSKRVGTTTLRGHLLELRAVRK